MRFKCLCLCLPLCLSFTVLVCLAQQSTRVKSAPPPGSPQDLVQQGKKLSQEGKQDEALALFQQALEKSPNLFEAHFAAGIALDLKGDYSQARKHLQKAVDVATPETMAEAMRNMAYSYAFEGKARKALEFEKPLFDNRIQNADWNNASFICSEMGRIYLDAGSPDQAYKWYKRSYETLDRNPMPSETDKNLRLYRWESAQARVAARRGKIAEAQQHVTAAKAAIDKANDPEQAIFYPYIAGYVGYYTGDYKTAIAELQKGDQHDPTVLALLAEAHEKSGDEAQAKDYYRKVLEINTHDLMNAFARPLAKKKLGM
jgi:tetratricopeptide (TPR) repeat protein